MSEIPRCPKSNDPNSITVLLRVRAWLSPPFESGIVEARVSLIRDGVLSNVADVAIRMSRN